MSAMSNANYSTRKEGQTKINTFTWTIPNFINLVEMKSRQDFRTEKSKGNNSDEADTRFQLKLMCLGRENDVIELYYMSPVPVFLKAILTMCLKQFEERSIMIKECHLVEANKWQYLSTLFKKELVGEDGRDLPLLSDGSLRLKIQFLVSNDFNVDPANVPKTQVAYDFETLLNNQLFSDITIKSMEGIEHKLQKSVPGAHFQHNTKCYTHVVESPFEAEVLNEVLTFIYSAKAPNIDKMPEKLLAAASYYGLRRLKSLCEVALHKKLTVDNAVETFQLADFHGATYLKASTLAFIKNGQMQGITKTEGWAKANSAELVKTIYKYTLGDDSELDIT